jgi:hypothetical protein
MAERVVHQDPYRAEQVILDDLPPHGLVDLIVDQDGMSASARLDRASATAVRDALSTWLGDRE